LAYINKFFPDAGEGPRESRARGFWNWECPVCLDEGVVTGWEGLIWDMREKTSCMN
jgi:hypothetical protein